MDRPVPLTETIITFTHAGRYASNVPFGKAIDDAHREYILTENTGFRGNLKPVWKDFAMGTRMKVLASPARYVHEILEIRP